MNGHHSGRAAVLLASAAGHMQSAVCSLHVKARQLAPTPSVADAVIL